jgi:hypothetical protein
MPRLKPGSYWQAPDLGLSLELREFQIEFSRVFDPPTRRARDSDRDCTEAATGNLNFKLSLEGRSNRDRRGLGRLGRDKMPLATRN